MTELIEVIRTTRKVGTGTSPEDIVHEHAQFCTPSGVLLTEVCTLDDGCGQELEGDPFALSDRDGGAA